MKFKIFLNTFFQIAAKVISSGFGFLVTLLLARFYSPADFGEYVKITAFVSAFWIMGDFGLNAIVLHKYGGDTGGGMDAGSQRRPPLQIWFNLLLTLRIIISLFLIFVCLATLAFLPQGYGNVAKLGIIFMSATILSQNIHLTCNSVFQFRLKYQKTLLAAGLANLASFILIGVAIYLKMAIALLVGTFTLSGMVLIITSLLLVRGEVGKIELVFDFSMMKKIFFAAAPLGLVLIFNVLYFHMDSFLLTVYKSSVEVGQYGLAYKFFETILVIPTFYGNSVYPVLLQRLNNDTVGFGRLFKKSAWLMAGAGVAATIGLVVTAPLFISLTTGNQAYAGAVNALQILSLSFPIYFATSIFMWYFVSLKKNVFLLWVYGSSLLLNFVLNWFFIPRFGFYASAWLTGICEAYILGIFIWYWKSSRAI